MNPVATIHRRVCVRVNPNHLTATTPARKGPAQPASSTPVWAAGRLNEMRVAKILQSPQPQETMRQAAALKKSLELVLHELRQAGARGGVDLGEEGRGVLLHQAVSVVCSGQWRS